MTAKEDRDPLTGLVRTGAFQAALDARRRVARAAGTDGNVTVGLVDIVALRHVNRDLGVDAGDELLLQVARRLERSGFATLVARVGPDEFALLSDRVGPDDGGQWLRALRTQVLRPEFELAGQHVKVHFHLARRAGPPPEGWDLLWMVERDAQIDRDRELRQQLAAFERTFKDAEEALRESLQLRSDMEVLRELAFRDPLTGLLNRRGMHDRLIDLAAAGSMFCLAFIDLDNLRELNASDELWEDGDKAIAGVAERLKEAFGSANVGRWGGDEYLVISPQTSASAVGEMLEGILADCRRELVVSGRPITFSAGVTDCVGGRLDDARALAQRTVVEAKVKKATVKVAQHDVR